MLWLPRARAVAMNARTASHSITLEVTTPRRAAVPTQRPPEARDDRLMRTTLARTHRGRVDQDPPATTAADPADIQVTRDADLRAAQLLQAFVQSGQRARGAPPGSGTAETPHAGRYLNWYTDQSERIRRALVFPRSRQLSLDQGTTLLRFSVARDGGLVGAPRVVRSSGFGDLDDAALAAVLRSAPFPPLPDEIAPNSPDVHLTVPVEFWNPTVH